MGGSSPHSRVYRTTGVERGVWGITWGVPGINRGDPGREGESNRAGPVRRISRGVVVVCSSLSVAMLIISRYFARLQPHFWWLSGSWSGMFISGTGPIGQGTGDKWAGNLNFSRFRLKEGSFFGQFYQSINQSIYFQDIHISITSNI